MMESLIVESSPDVDDDKVCLQLPNRRCHASPSGHCITADTTQDKTPLSFLSLPTEIRNKIYRYSLVKRPSANPILGLVQPPLTRTNRQIRSEALPIYYGNNEFVLEILPESWKDDTDCWANVIRMFREFKAGRTGGRGTGSLQSIRHLTYRISSESFLALEVILIDTSKRRARKKKGRGCRSWEAHAGFKPKDERVLQRWDLVYRLVEMSLGGEAEMHDSGMRRLVSTIVMVANECPAVTKEVHFHYDRRGDELSPFEDPFASDINDS